MTHTCVGNLTIIGSDNGLSPGRRQAIIWNNADLLSIGHLGTKFNEILIEILTFAFKKLRLKMSSAKWRPFCPGWDGLISYVYSVPAPCVTCTVVNMCARHVSSNQGRSLAVVDVEAQSNAYIPTLSQKHIPLGTTFAILAWWRSYQYEDLVLKVQASACYT